jgi:hypothetical protein
MTKVTPLIPDDISLRENNPYSIGTIFLFDEGDFLLDREPAKFTKSARDRYYTVENDKDLLDIAFEAYGDAKWWWLIYDANPDLGNPFDLAVGKTLLIPDLIKAKVTALDV